jgi:hypothetical protein
MKCHLGFRATVLAAGMGVFLWSAPMSGADTVFDFTFQSVYTSGSSAGQPNDVIQGSGTLDATPNAVGSEVYTATSGSGSMTTSDPADYYSGTFNLITNPYSPIADPGNSSFATSPNGAFWYDDQLFFPGTGTTQVDWYGLLFAGTDNPATEINLCTAVNPAGLPYVYIDSSEGAGNWVPNSYGEVVTFGLELSITAANVPPGDPTPVPLPAAAGIGFSLLGGCGVLAAFRKRLRRQSRIA